MIDKEELENLTEVSLEAYQDLLYEYFKLKKDLSLSVRKPLSGKAVDKLIKENMFDGVLQPYSFVNAIEKAHGIGEY